MPPRIRVFFFLVAVILIGDFLQWLKWLLLRTTAVGIVLWLGWTLVGH